MIKAGRLNENYRPFGYWVLSSEVPNFKICGRQRVGDGGASFVGTGDVDELRTGVRGWSKLGKQRHTWLLPDPLWPISLQTCMSVQKVIIVEKS